MTIFAKSRKNYQVEITASSHDLLADEPVSNGGDDAGPSPYDLLLSSLAACKIITVHMYAKRKEWALETVTMRLEHKKVSAADCDDCTSPRRSKVDIINCEIHFTGDLDEDQMARLAEIADRCPVHRTLTSETKIRTRRAEAVAT